MKSLITTATTALLISVSLLNAQTSSPKITDNDLSTIKKLNVRGYFSFYIPPNPSIGLGVDLNADAQYTMSKLLQLRGGIAAGVFTGARIGATYYLSNCEKDVKYKFVVSRTKTGNTTVTRYYTQFAKARNILGIAGDVQSGVLKNSGFLLKVDAGLEFQTFGKAFSERDGTVYAGNRNGWLSVKAQLVYVNCFFDATFPETDARRNGIGFQIAPQVATKPWKKFSFYAGLPMGFIKTIGIKEDAITPILSINVGMGLNF